MASEEPKHPARQALIIVACVIVVVVAVVSVAWPVFFRSCEASLEGAACSTLKSGIFPAEIVFQAGALRDRDRNQVGEFAELGALGTADVHLIVGPLASGDTADGYRFTIFVPEAPVDAERFFIAYAWPVSTDQERHAFALTQDGQVRESPTMAAAGQAPAWDTALPGGWAKPSSWPTVSQAQEQRARARAGEER